MTLFSSEKKQLNDNESDTSSCEYDGPKDYQRNNILLCATHGKIYALHKRSGNKLWSAKFPSGAMGGIVSIFVTDFDKVIVGANGKTACLDLMTGKTLWLNRMSGFGYEEVSVISTPSRILTPKKEPVTDSPPEYSESHSLGKPIIFGCSRGKVMAMDADSGNELWRYNCPGGWYNIPVAIVEPPSWEDHQPDQFVYIGAGKWVYCLQSQTGDVIWSTKVSSAIFGLNYMTLATPWSSRLAAEAYSAFSQNPSAQTRDREREDERRSS
ncbi:hypothetical protein G6F37_010568 [Rhizopus arrhizus]|nr:hypothetical protein G6F38_010635 [Rhizopus arrhizus]KAG1153203.1 hypothetical protein G6F37_010568 [Rhizopus arrhizus]